MPDSSIVPVALITGASSGVGRALAVALAAEGYDLVLAARRRDALEQTAKLATEAATGDLRVVCQPTDIADVDQIEALMAVVSDQFGRLDVLANVAGLAGLQTIERTSRQEWDAMVAVNLSPVVHTTRLAWPMFRKQKSGFVVNISSMASKDPFPGFASYATLKCGVNMFTLMTGREGARLGIRAVCIAPGAVETDMLRSMFNTKTIPEEQALAPEDLATLIVACVKGEREFESGQTLFVSR